MARHRDGVYTFLWACLVTVRFSVFRASVSHHGMHGFVTVVYFWISLVVPVC